jgi:catechol 2,3-dioxygenase-like lactoylglutathione lyase family enzyme
VAAKKTKLRASGPAKTGSGGTRGRAAPPSKKTSAKPAPARQRAPAKPIPAPPPRPAPVVQMRSPGKKGEAVFDRLHQVALVSHNLDHAVAFYGDVLGLPMIARFDPPGLAFFDLGGGVRLMLAATASSATLYFHVKDVDEAYKALAKRGVRFLHKPALIHRDDAGQFGKKGSEEWMAFFKDPSENILALVGKR